MPDGDASFHGTPELVSVGRRNGWRSAFVAVAAVALLLGAAVWKPWEGGRPGPGSRPATIPTDDRQAELLPRHDRSGADGSDRPDTLSRRRTFGGLDLEFMGISDPHAAWGVAVAYVSRTQIDNAIAGRSPTVTPVVSWELIEPDRSPPGPRLDHATVTSVAIAATWPLGTRPVAIRLFLTGRRPPAPDPRRPSRESTWRDAGDLGRRARPARAPAVGSSGAFFLRGAPTPPPATRPAGSVTAGRPAPTTSRSTSKAVPG